MHFSPIQIVLVTAITTLVAVLVGAFLTGALRERGRQWMEDRRTLRTRKQKLRQHEEQEAADLERRKIADLEKFQDRRLLERARVGERFLWRASPDDEGMLGTVVGLDRLHPKIKVRVKWISPPDREPSQHDYSTDTVTIMEWGSLTRSPADQRHRTALLIANSFNDEDGWIEYERIGRPGQE